MLRRSSSQSNIPLLKTNLFGTKDGKVKRSQSISRLSQRDSVPSVNQLAPQRKSSLDRKSSTIGLLKTTPLHRLGLSSGSLLKSTPSSALSQRSSRITTPLCRKNYASIQKLSSDKRWVAEQFAKVQNFIMSSQLFDLSVVNANNIKPPSINNFIYVTGVLLTEIFPRLKISKENFKEVVPAQLKLLRYPGTLTNSTLKTVNTMHSWPQIIGMWGWLIDKVSLSNNSVDMNLDSLEPEQRTNFLINQNCSDFIMQRYIMFNLSNGQENKDEIEKTNEAYVKNLADLLDVNFERFKELENDVTQKKALKIKQAEKLERVKAETAKLASEVEEMVTEIEEFEENGSIEEIELQNQLQILQSNINEHREAIESTNKTIVELREALATQPCTHLEKLALLKQIDELSKEIALKKDKIEHAKEIKIKFDYKLSTEITKIQSLVIQWNRSLMEISFKKPFLKKLMLREKGFHDPNFLNELQQMSNYKNTIETEVTEALAKTETQKCKEELKQEELEKEIKELNEIVRRTNQECATISKEIEEIELEMKKVIQDLEQMKQSHAKQITDLQTNNTLDNKTKIINELKNTKEQLSVEVKKFRSKMLGFFVEMQLQVIGNLKEMEIIKGKLAKEIESRNEDILAKQKMLIEILKSTDTQ